MSRLRQDMVQEALSGQCSVAQLARKYNVSRKTIYKWLKRAEAPDQSLDDQPRTPHRCPRTTSEPLCARIVQLRRQYPAWGADKIRALLGDQGPDLPCERTVHRIIQRAGLVNPAPEPAPEPQRFERAAPNELWQLDFKGPLRLGSSMKAPTALTLSIVDDYSRFAVALHALPDRRLETVWRVVWATFGEYGLPEAILTDNQNGLFASHQGGITHWTSWLWRLGISHLRGRPYHPQTQGKVERFHKTLRDEIFLRERHSSIEALGEALGRFRQCYNHIRPHEALGQRPPISRYRPSERSRPPELPEMAYPPGAVLRRVSQAGYVSLQGRRVHVGEGLTGERVEVRTESGVYELRYGRRVLRILHCDELTEAEQWI